MSRLFKCNPSGSRVRRTRLQIGGNDPVEAAGVILTNGDEPGVKLRNQPNESRAVEIRTDTNPNATNTTSDRHIPTSAE